MKISPSRLVYAEACPKFKPTPFTNDAAEEGIQLHEYMEQLVQQPIDTWDEWINGLQVSASSKALITTAMTRIQPFAAMAPDSYPDTILPGNALVDLEEGLPPGMYPELKIRIGSPGQNKFGFIDLLISLGFGNYIIIDYKFVRGVGDYELQLAAYACALNLLVPEINTIQALIVAPYLADDVEPMQWNFTKENLASYAMVIKGIEEAAENPNNDGRPGSHCEYCKWSGQCRYQTTKALDITAPSLPPNVQRLLKPKTLQDRADRRDLIKCLESMVESIKEDDKKFFAEHPDAVLPGYKVTQMSGRATVDKERASEINDTLLSRFVGLINVNDLLSMATPEPNKVVAHLTLHGMDESNAKRSVNEAFDEFMKRGASYVTLRKAGTKTRVPKKLSND